MIFNVFALPAMVALALAAAAALGGASASPVLHSRSVHCTAPKGSTPVKMTKNWTCMSHGSQPDANYIAVSMTPAGLPACLSWEGRNCMWSSQECCESIVKSADDTAPYLECGQAKAQVWGDDGMVDENGWCMRAKAMLASIPDDASPEVPEPSTGDASHGRLFISDNVTAAVQVIHLGASSATFAQTVPVLARAPSLQTAPNERFVYVVHYGNNSVQVIDSGLYMDEHGDHSHLEDDGVSLHPFNQSGVRPAHVNQNGGYVLTFFDGISLLNATEKVDAIVTVFEAKELEVEGSVIQPQSFKADRGHHGVAIAINGHYVASISEKDGPTGSAIPSAVTVRTMADPERGIHQINCTSLHGEAKVGDSYVVFGCLEGLASVNVPANGTPSSVLAPYPANTAGRVGTLVYSDDLPVTVGGHGEALVSYNPATNTLTRKGLPDSTRPLRFGITGKTLVVLDANGTLYAMDPITLDPLSGSVGIKTVGNDGKGYMAVGGDRVAVGKAGENVVQIFNLHDNDLEWIANVTIPGTPAGMIIAAAYGHQEHDH